MITTASKRWGAVLRVGRDRALLLRVIAASLLLSTNWLLYVFAVTHNNVVETALGYFIAPLVTVSIGVIVFHEHLHRTQIAALVLAGVAVALLTVEAGRVPWIALALAVSWGFYGLIKRQIPLHPIESLAAETFVLLPVAIVITVLVETHSSAIHLHAHSWRLAMVAGTGLITVIPLLFFGIAARRLAFSVLGPLQYFVPIINFTLGVAFYNEAMSTLKLTGFGLVWVALIVFSAHSIQMSRLQRSNRDSQPVAQDLETAQVHFHAADSTDPVDTGPRPDCVAQPPPLHGLAP